MPKEAETWGGLVWPSTVLRRLNLDEGTMWLPLILHVIVAGGKLPEWVQKKMTGDPSSTVCPSGSAVKELRITGYTHHTNKLQYVATKEEKITILCMSINFEVLVFVLKKMLNLQAKVRVALRETLSRVF